MSRTIAVTGAASGIGAALTTLLRERGEQVITVDRHDADVVADLSTAQGCAAAVAAIQDVCGGTLDALVTCAGLSAPVLETASVNFFGTTALVEGLREQLAAAPAPRVGLIGSIAGTQPNDPDLVRLLLEGDRDKAMARADELMGSIPFFLYTSSKAAVAQWMRRTCVAPGWADAGIAMNAVAPGVVLTPMTDDLFADPAMKQVMDEAVPMPLNGYAKAEDVAALLAWLVSVENTHVTGQVIYIDGGAEASLRPNDHF
ncbi:SDR family oxidoreductase [Nocardioides pacificus]